MEKKPIKRLTVVLYGACAVIWTVRSVLDFAYDQSMFFKVLDPLCAAIWFLAFCKWLKRYRSKDGQEETGASVGQK